MNKCSSCKRLRPGEECYLPVLWNDEYCPVSHMLCLECKEQREEEYHERKDSSFFVKSECAACFQAIRSYLPVVENEVRDDSGDYYRAQQIITIETTEFAAIVPRQEEDLICKICLDKPVDSVPANQFGIKCFPLHGFCFDCIAKEARKHLVLKPYKFPPCPCCKRPFHRIKRGDTEIHFEISLNPRPVVSFVDDAGDMVQI